MCACVHVCICACESFSHGVPVSMREKGTSAFLISKRAIFRKVKAVKEFRGDVHLYVAQGIPEAQGFPNRLLGLGEQREAKS